MKPGPGLVKLSLSVCISTSVSPTVLPSALLSSISSLRYQREECVLIINIKI